MRSDICLQLQDRQSAGTVAGSSAARPVSDGAVARAFDVQAVSAAPGIAAGGRANPVQTASDRVSDPGQAAQAPALTAVRLDEAATSHASGREAPGQAAQGTSAGLSNGHGGHHAGGTNNAWASHANGHNGSPGEVPERAAEEGAEDAAAALMAFRAAAERRARQYGAFNAGFQRYLARRDEGTFRFGLRFGLGLGSGYLPSARRAPSGAAACLPCPVRKLRQFYSACWPGLLPCMQVVRLWRFVHDVKDSRVLCGARNIC